MSEEPVQFMQQVVSIEYEMQGSALDRRYASEIRKRHILGHQCPACEAVYVPPRGFCPMCCIETGEENEIVVQDRGTVTSFTIVSPVQYRGQEEKEVYVTAGVLLDGAGIALGQQRIGEIASEEVRTGLRVQAEWAADEKGNVSIAHWAPTGEPDVPPEELRDHAV
jgi:uncharacterized OB-fold protein